VTIAVYLLDDHEVVRRGLRELLDVEPDIDVVGESGSALEAARRIPVRTQYQIWLARPLQVHNCTRVPFALLPLYTSRHRDGSVVGSKMYEG